MPYERPFYRSDSTLQLVFNPVIIVELAKFLYSVYSSIQAQNDLQRTLSSFQESFLQIVRAALDEDAMNRSKDTLNGCARELGLIANEANLDANWFQNNSDRLA